MADLMGKFPVHSKYYESPLLPPELAAIVTSPSGSVVNLGVTDVPSVGCARFEFIFPLPMATGVAVSEEAVSVSVWAAWEAPELSSKSVHSIPYVRMSGDNAGVCE